MNDIVEFISDAEGVILGLEKMDRSILAQLKYLKIIAKFGVGLDNLDIDAATEFGITVGGQVGSTNVQLPNRL